LISQYIYKNIILIHSHFIMLTPEQKLLRKQKLNSIRNTPIYRKERNFSNSNSNSDNTPTPKSNNNELELKTPMPNSKNIFNKISFDFI